MLLAFTVVDYAVLGFYLLSMIVIGGYFSSQQHTSKDFFLAGRSMGWFPVGLSIMATLLSALSYTGVPGEAYKQGLNLLLYGMSIWLTLPLMMWLVIPIFRGLELYSIYEYLEYRFSLSVRLAGSAVFVIWRLLWLGGVLYAPCKVVLIAADMPDKQLTVMLLVLGAVSTIYTYLGGMKAVIWTDVIQTAVMVGGLVLIVGTAWTHLDGGASRVWEVAKDLSRDNPLPTAFEPGTFFEHKWLVWSMVPHMFFAFLSFYVADQITAQRFLTTKNMQEVKRSYILNCVSVTLMMSALMYVGMTLLAFYHDHPQEMRPYWVVNATGDTEDPTGKQLLKDPETGEPYIQRQTPLEEQGKLESLIASGAILNPNTQVPLEDAAGLRDPESGEIVIDRLAKRHPGSGERMIQRGTDELMPTFIARHLKNGIAGLILAALLAASMSSMDSGLNSITTLVITDFYRRLKIGRGTMARLRGKSEDQLDETDELWLGRRVVLVIGVAATLFALLVSQLGNIFDIMISVCNTFGAPLLAVFLLGMLTRRCTARAALIAMVVGMPYTVWLAFGYDWGLWPFATKMNSLWAVTFGVLGTMALGYLLSLVLGTRREERELSGLVWGIGHLGVRGEKPAQTTKGPAIELPEGPPEDPRELDTRWR